MLNIPKLLGALLVGWLLVLPAHAHPSRLSALLDIIRFMEGSKGAIGRMALYQTREGQRLLELFRQARFPETSTFRATDLQRLQLAHSELELPTHRVKDYDVILTHALDSELKRVFEALTEVESGTWALGSSPGVQEVRPFVQRYFFSRFVSDQQGGLEIILGKTPDPIRAQALFRSRSQPRSTLEGSAHFFNYLVHEGGFPQIQFEIESLARSFPSPSSLKNLQHGTDFDAVFLIHDGIPKEWTEAGIELNLALGTYESAISIRCLRTGREKFRFNRAIQTAQDKLNQMIQEEGRFEFHLGQPTLTLSQESRPTGIQSRIGYSDGFGISHLETPEEVSFVLEVLRKTLQTEFLGRT